jgi:hypothetical protein
METQQTQTLEATAEVAPPVVAAQPEAAVVPPTETEVAEVPAESTTGVQVTPATASVAVLLLGLLAVAVKKLLKK